MGKTESSVKGFVVVAFILLGALFGMIIMSFIFVQLGPNTSSSFADLSATVTNETGAWLNSTTYTVDDAGVKGFSGLAITGAYNISNVSEPVAIGIGNFTVVGGGFTNSSGAVWPDVSVSYSYNLYSSQRNAVEESSNNSLQGIIAYTAQATTQFNVVSVAIILIILIAVFLIFWKIFVKGDSKGNSGGSFG